MKSYPSGTAEEVEKYEKLYPSWVSEVDQRHRKCFEIRDVRISKCYDLQQGWSYDPMDGALHVADFEKRFSRVKFPLVTSIMRPVLYGRDLKGRYCLQQLLLVQASPEPGAPDKEAGEVTYSLLDLYQVYNGPSRSLIVESAMYMDLYDADFIRKDSLPQYTHPETHMGNHDQFLIAMPDSVREYYYAWNQEDSRGIEAMFAPNGFVWDQDFGVILKDELTKHIQDLTRRVPGLTFEMVEAPLMGKDALGTSAVHLHMRVTGNFRTASEPSCSPTLTPTPLRVPMGIYILLDNDGLIMECWHIYDRTIFTRGADTSDASCAPACGRDCGCPVQ
jgi:hypothetical protein